MFYFNTHAVSMHYLNCAIFSLVHKLFDYLDISIYLVEMCYVHYIRVLCFHFFNNDYLYDLFYLIFNICTILSIIIYNLL
jgi:hypothetical protein